MTMDEKQVLKIAASEKQGRIAHVANLLTPDEVVSACLAGWLEFLGLDYGYERPLKVWRITNQGREALAQLRLNDQAIAKAVTDNTLAAP